MSLIQLIIRDLIGTGGIIAVVTGGYMFWHLYQTFVMTSDDLDLLIDGLFGIIASIATVLGAATLGILFRGIAFSPVWAGTLAVVLGVLGVLHQRFRTRHRPVT